MSVTIKIKLNACCRFLLGSCLCFSLSTSLSSAQIIRGGVFCSEEEGYKIPLPGATIYLSHTNTGTTSDENGLYSLQSKSKEGYLIVKYLGFRTDSIALAAIENGYAEFILEAVSESAAEIIVTGEQRGTLLSAVSSQKTELISKVGLMKMACCNLSESFENSATVTVGFTDAVSGARQVQLLGLSGIYSQMLAENVPTMRGLAASYGWSYTPGSWLESIQISKGASSVINGYESVSGQMNLEFKKPDNTEDLFVNLFADDASRYEANITAAVKVADKVWTGLLLHGSLEREVHDKNHDGFMDMPKTKFVNIFNRWFYLDPGKGIESRTGLRFLYDQRNGGQHKSLDNFPLYTSDINNKNFTLENKTGFSVGGREGQSLGVITSFTHHEQNSFFGKKSYKGDQDSFYLNTLFTSFIGTKSHQYTVGASFSYDNYNTSFEDRLEYNDVPSTKIDREELVPGIYGQYTYSPSEKITFLTGVRGDYNTAYGWLFTPRMNLRYSLIDEIVLRGSMGRGFRSPNIIAENIGLLASSRNFYLDDINNLDIERAWNFGGNISFYIPVWNARILTLSFDYFRTNFQNQVVVDMERNRHSVYFYDLKGKSYADAWQADMSLTIFKGFDFFTAFRYNNTRITYQQNSERYQVEKPLVSRYRGLVNLSYATNLRKWVFDFTSQVNGPSRLPGLLGYNTPKETSPVFPVFFFQVTKNTKRFDIYLGVENIGNYKQKNPIIEPGDPFGKNFDSSIIWGPLMGRKIYAGIRLRLGNF